MPNQIDQLRDDFRVHAQNDEQQLRDLRLDVGIVREDVKDLIRETATQNVKLDHVISQLSQRARTESQQGKYKRSLKLILWRAIVPAIVGGSGYLLVHFVF